jgi:hypothetical protein
LLLPRKRSVAKFLQRVFPLHTTQRSKASLCTYCRQRISDSSDYCLHGTRPSNKGSLLDDVVMETMKDAIIEMEFFVGKSHTPHFSLFFFLFFFDIHGPVSCTTSIPLPNAHKK